MLFGETVSSDRYVPLCAAAPAPTDTLEIVLADTGVPSAAIANSTRS